jgi:hypothetical protein
MHPASANSKPCLNIVPLYCVLQARAGGVFEVSEAIAQNDLDYKFVFDKTVSLVQQLGSLA